MGNNFSVESPSCDQPCLPFLCGKRKYLYNMEENLKALHKVMQDLNAMRNDLLKRVSKEEDIGLQGLQEVKGWISMVEEIEPKANRLLDESVSEIQRLSRYGYCSLIPASTYRYSEKVLRTLKGVKTLISKGVFEVVVHRALPPLVIKMPPIQLTVSQQNLFERACNFLEEINVGTLGIYGRGGVGKTTLLTKIKNKFQEAFGGLVIFVVVGSEEVEGIQEEISNRLDLQWRETKEEKAAEIFMALKGKRFLLLLDGIQREVNLEEIGVPFPSRENGCKIVFTTRSRDACDESKGVDAKVEITCLSPEEAWDLFQETVGENTLRSHQDIPKLARVVASTCRGLPLALNLIGETMSRKRTVREWRYTIHVLASSTAEFPDMEDGALPILKSIYDNMSDENIRLCFLYCALFPENCDIRKEDLANYWIGERILAKEDRERAEIQGYEIICDLVRMRLLMESGNGYCVKMHGMVREMALWIASDFGRQIEHFVVVGGERIHQLPMVNDWGMVRRMSVMSTQIQNISESLQCSELTTLFFRRNRHLKWISGAFFRWMTSLVVLDLSFNRELAELPEEVSSLVLLRFLNLSWTCIKGLPLGLKELRSLIHLDLDYTSNLQEVDVIASLLNLQVLRLFQSVPMDLKLMEDIQLLTSLKELSLTVRGSSVLQRLLSIHRLASSIQRLHLTKTTIADGGSLSLNAMFGLRELDILGCNIPEITIDWRSTIQRETVHLGNIEKIPQFRNIRTVAIHGCKFLRELTWLLLAPSIRDLSLSECPLVEEVISKEKAMAKLGHTSEQPFQNLTKLVLNGLPQLESIYWTPLPFPVLEYLEIRRCPELKRLPLNSESAIGNQVEMKIEEQWIKVVEWEDEATKQRFSHFNNRDFPQMAEDPKMDGLTSESHPIQNIDLFWTTEEEEEEANETDLCWSYHSSSSPSKTGLHSHASTNNYNYGTEFSSSSTTTTGWTTNSVGRQSHFLEWASESSGGIMNEPGQILEPPNLKVFSFLDLKMAARNFKPDSLLGQGRFGKVYKGWIDAKTLAPSKAGSGMIIAIRRLNSESAQELAEWQSRVNFFGMLSHPNLVKLLGYCLHDKELLLVYEYIPRGSLEHKLFRGIEPFPWDLRIKIVLGAARGLAFLHGLQRKVIYRDFKPSKILLDSNYEAKISDPILAKLGPSEEESHITTMVMGTYAYLAPEYMATGRLYVKSDVYVFGVVLLEVMTRLRAHDRKRPTGQEILVDWLRPKLSSKHGVTQIMDKGIKGECTYIVATEMGRIILSCIEPDPKNRPYMQEVVDVLEHIQRINVVRR